MPTLAILKLDQIGDYVIFRNFIKEIKNSQQYKDYRIVLIGNIIYKKFAKTLDGEYIESFIGVNKRSYRKYPLYRMFIKNEINAQRIDVLISPTYSRDAQWVENIVKATEAPIKIGSLGDGTNITLGQKREADRHYTQLIEQDEKPMFEYDRYKEFFEKLLKKKFSSTVPKIEVEDVEKARLVGFFPGAGSKYRRWSPLNFAKVADFIKENYGYKICILGGKQDKKFAKEIMKNSSADFINMTGKVPLEKLPKYCKKLQFVVTNDTAGLHISAAVGTKTICISNGTNYPRFVKYPSDDIVKVAYLDEVEKHLGNAKYIKDNLLYGSIFNINDISVEKVVETIKEFIPKPAKTAVKKEPAKKTTVEKTSAKVSAQKVAPAKKAATKTATAKKTATKTTTKTTFSKTSAKATTVKKPTTKTATVKKTATKKTTAKKPAAAKKATTKKTIAKKEA